MVLKHPAMNAPHPWVTSLPMSNLVIASVAEGGPTMLDDIIAGSGDAFAWFAACVAAGFVADQILYRVVSLRAAATGRMTIRALASALHWLPTALGVTVGAAIAVSRLDLEGRGLDRAADGVRALAILVVTAFGARILGRLVRVYTQRAGAALPGGTIFVNLTRGTVWVLGALSLLATVGVSVAPLITALGVGGLAVGLALQPTLENVFSGIQLLVSRQIKPGDFIRLETGEEGTVLDVTWRNTTVRRLSNDVVIVPNSVLARATVTNFTSLDPEYVLLVPVSFASAGDPDEIERIALEVARDVIAACPEAVADQEPGARFADLTPPAAVLNVTIRCRSYQERVAVRHEFVRRLAKRFSAEGVEAPPMSFAAGRPRP